MAEKSFSEHIWLALRCEGLLEFASRQRGFSIIDVLEGKAMYQFVCQEFKKSAHQGIIVCPTGFGNIPGVEQQEAIAEGKRYVKALKKMGLDSELLISGDKGRDDMVNFRVFVYVPIEQETRRPDCDKLQVQLRITGYGQLFDYPVRHDVVVELTIDSPGAGRGWRVSGAAPQNCEGNQMVFEGRGIAQGSAVIAWLAALDRSMTYVPVHQEAEEKEEGKRKGRK